MITRKELWNRFIRYVDDKALVLAAVGVTISILQNSPKEEHEAEIIKMENVLIDTHVDLTGGIEPP